MREYNTELIESYKRVSNILVEDAQKTLNPNLVQSSVRNRLLYHHKTIGFQGFIIDKNPYKLKQEFSTVGMIATYLYEVKYSHWMGFGIRYLTYALISDNKSLIKHMASISVNPESRKTLLETGNCMTLAFISLLKKDLEEVSIYLKSIENASRKSKATAYHFIYIDILNSFLHKDELLLKNALQKLESKRLRSHRIKHLNDEKYISGITTGFCKLSKRYGMHVEIDSEFVHSELLDIKPLDKYEVQYPFLKEHFDIEKLGWSYNPIC